MVRKEPQVQKIFASSVMRERMMTKSTGSDVIPVYGGFTIIVLVLQVSQTDFGLALIVKVTDSHSCCLYYVVCSFLFFMWLLHFAVLFLAKYQRLKPFSYLKS